MTTIKKNKKSHYWIVNLIFASSILFLILSCNKENEVPQTNEINYDTLNPFQTKYPNEEVIKCAHDNLAKFIQSISWDGISNYGFYSESELQRIEIGNPYLEIFLNQYFYEDTIFVHMAKYIYNVNEWQVPLLVDNDMRCFLLIGNLNDSISFIGGGGSLYAKRVDLCENTYGLKNYDRRYLLDTHGYRFIMCITDSSTKLYPIGDSNTYVIPCVFKVHESFEDFFYAYKLL